jgi:hypothetical protein
MKSLFILLFISSIAMACDKGCTEYEGNCACDQKPIIDNTPEAKPSDEKPPSDKMPSYQREGIHADMPQSKITEDAKWDAENAKADAAGKKAAGL